MARKKNRSRSSSSFSKYLKTHVTPKNDEQREMMSLISANTITFIKGPAGCGKTFVAVNQGLCEFLKENYEQLIFSRKQI